VHKLNSASRRGLSLISKLVFVAVGLSAHFYAQAQILDIEEKYSFSQTPCWFSTNPEWSRIDCGTLLVPENYDDPNSRAVELPVVVVYPYELASDKFPLVFAGGGGPGNALSIASEGLYEFGESAWYSVFYSTVNSGRKLVLIDNRGVGQSKPNLNCPEVETSSIIALDKNLDDVASLQLYGDSLRACKERLEAEGVDLSQYQIENAAHDLEALRIALGEEKINVLGVSYGSRVALVYEKTYPDSVRALVLDGVYPPWVKSFEEMARQNEDSIQGLFRACNANTQCAKRFGLLLEAEFQDALDRLSESPVQLTITSPVNLKPIRVQLTPQLLVGVIWGAMYYEWEYARLPLVVKSVINGNTDMIAELVRLYLVNTLTIESLDEGAYASYTCFDEVPFANFSAINEQLSELYYQAYLNSEYVAAEQEMCRIWQVPSASPDFKERHEVKAPTLLLSGQLDPATPPVWADEVSRQSRKAWSKTWLNLGHNVLSSADCADELAARFLDSPEAVPFDLDCVAQEFEMNFVQY